MSRTQDDGHPPTRRTPIQAVAVFIMVIAVSISLWSAAGTAIGVASDVTLVYLLATLPLAVSAAMLVRDRDNSVEPAARSMRVTVALLVIGTLCLILVPSVYVAARSRHDLRTIDDLLSESRLGEAKAKTDELLRLAPSLQWRSRPLKDLAQQLDRSVHDLEQQIANSPPTPANNDRLSRCRQLAMLGRTDEALSDLAFILQTDSSLVALDLAGTIHEADGEWVVAGTFHQRAKDAWQKQDASPDRTRGLLRATTRLAYCERKLGRYELAEQGYLEAVALSPTAENHFLVAQFYEDMQQSTKARTHARTAMALDPQGYDHAGKKLLDKLIIGHFGCLNVFREESAAHATESSELATKSLTSF